MRGRYTYEHENRKELMVILCSGRDVLCVMWGYVCVRERERQERHKIDRTRILKKIVYYKRILIDIYVVTLSLH